MLDPGMRFGLLCLGVAVASAVPDASAVVIWDQEFADRYGIAQPYEYSPEGDCTYFLKGNLSPEVQTPAKFEIWQRMGSGEEYPLLGMTPGIVAIWDNETQRLIGYPVVEGEETQGPVNFTYVSEHVGEHSIGISDNDATTGNRGESYDTYSVNVDGLGYVQLGEKWCEGGVPVVWVNPPAGQPNSTVGKITGGGWIVSNMKNFGFNAQFDTDKGLKGHLTYIDRDYGRLQSTTLDYLVIEGSHATLVGKGELDDQEVSFTVEVDDLAEPGMGHDQFKISWSGGYSAGGVLSGGNVQIHR